MTLNNILNEVNIEFGNGQSLAVTDALKQRTTYDKTGAKDELYTKTADLTTRRIDTKGSVANVINYLKKKGVWDKVASKQSFRTTDLVFKADGSCRVNYDEGGGILVPKEIANATTPVAQKTFIQKFKEKIQASAITEDVLEEYLLNEEITGNMAIVYHRGDKKKLGHLLKQTYTNNSHVDFYSYSKGLYTTTNMESQLNQVGNLNNMKDTYGNFIIKLAFKGVSNCWFCSFDEYKKYNRCTIDNWKEQQLKKFNIDKKYWVGLSGEDKNFTANHTTVSKFFEYYKLLGKSIKGIQYFGKQDGNCLLIYDWTTAVPLAVSNNEGKTWKKINKNKTAFQRSNFKNNDYVDTNKVIKQPLKVDFKANSLGNINCSENQLTTLEGAPKEVGGNFRCSENHLTTLKGAPQKVGGIFECSENHLTTLKGAPKEVGGSFDCSYNKLTTLEGAPQEVGGSFECNDNKLTTLKGAPQVVNWCFDCSGNKLTTLEGAPQKVGGIFNCCKNNLSKEKIINYLKAAKIGEGIYTDYGNFENQKEALKKLTENKKVDYFPY